MVGGKALTNIEHRYWQLCFLQLPQLLILEWVYFLKDPLQSIQSARTSNLQVSTSYFAYFDYIVQQYKAQYPLAF
ncbi:hypothetical protein HMI54_009658 [Coelomomyces lativittatus]|nr:hypothetical protein HMI54_009658 [Coelomomyces lativittatus]